jgi:hypothetical protein
MGKRHICNNIREGRNEMRMAGMELRRRKRENRGEDGNGLRV